jgi:two-component system chemotaxis response regulator CheB
MNANSDLLPNNDVDIQIVALAASAGGLKALTILLSALPHDFPVPLVVVQHLSPHQPSMMADILRRRIALPVTQAEEGDALRPGHVYLAPPGKHLLVTPQRLLSLTGTEKVHFVRPSADVLFESVAASFGRNAVAVILTGGDGDGAAGIQAVKRAGGITIAQDQATSESFSMPRNAIETGAVDYILPLEAIAPMLMSLVCR